jgi:hypothetical protein
MPALSWLAAYANLAAIALLPLSEPSGRLFGLDASLSGYLRVAPVPCAFLTLDTLIQFTFWSVKERSSFKGAKRVVLARGVRIVAADDADPRPERPADREFREKAPGVLRAMAFLVSWYPFLQVAGTNVFSPAVGFVWCYMASFLTLVGVKFLAQYAKDDTPPPLGEIVELGTRGQGPEPRRDDRRGTEPRTVLEWCRSKSWEWWYNASMLSTAVMLQLFLLTWVDFMVHIPEPYPPLSKIYAFRVYRLGAHIMAYGFHWTLRSDNVSVAIDSKKAIFRYFLLLASSVVFLAGLFDNRFTLLYYLASVVIVAFSWVLYSDRRLRQWVRVQEVEDYKIVMGLDFWIRNVSLSLFWYANFYDPQRTSSIFG